MDIISVLRVVTIALVAAIIVYLGNVYVEKREKVTLVLLAFFLVYMLERIYAFLGELNLIITSWVTEINIGMVLSVTALAIPIALMKLRELYVFPPVVGTALVAVNMVSSYSRDLIVYLFNIIFYLKGYNIWYPLIDVLNRAYLQNSYFALFANPVDALLIPDQSYIYLLMSGILLALPAFIMFSILVWREKSGKALGFLIGLIIISAGAAFSANQPYIPFELIGISIIALGIFGLIDKHLFKNVKGTHYPKKSVKTN
jgi:hypothetical protein